MSIGGIHQMLFILNPNGALASVTNNPLQVKL